MTESKDPDALGTRPVALLVEYDGTTLHGLQRQDHTSETVQGYLERAARTIGSPDPDFAASGRTDSGVHATGQVVRMAIPARLDTPRIRLALNANLPNSIRVLHSAECPADFHPRFDARQRLYIYRLCAKDPVPPLVRNHVAFIKSDIDLELAQEAAAAFVGFWELKEWRSSICQAKRTRMHIDQCDVAWRNFDIREGRGYFEITVAARSFLHNQVRLMVGAIVAVASGKLMPEELRRNLEQGTRPTIVKKESAKGLTMTRVIFAEGKDPFLG